MATNGPSWSTEEKRLRLWRGEPLKFAAPPSDGSEAPDARAARTIPAAWLEELAARPARAVGVPITISHAIVEVPPDRPLDLTYATFAYQVAITDSDFTGGVDFSFTTFERVVEFDGSRFLGLTVFRAAHAAYDFRIKRANFAHETIFNDLQVDQDLDVSGAHFEKLALFGDIQVGKAFFWVDAQGTPTRFSGAAYFFGAHVRSIAQFSGAQFVGDASFGSVQVGGSAIFGTDAQGTPVRFEGEANFEAAHIGGSAMFSGAQFADKATFAGIKVVGETSFTADPPGKPVLFTGKADFTAAHIGEDADFMGAQFVGDATFDWVQVRGSAFFGAGTSGNPVRFGGTASFVGAHIGKIAIFSGAQFVRDASFEWVQVDGSAYFEADTPGNPVRFNGEVNFFAAQIRGVARFGGAQFDQAASFGSIEAEGLAVFVDAHFMSLSTFHHARFAESVSFQNTKFKGDADFTAAVADRDVDFRGAVFSENATFFDTRFRVVRYRGDLTRKIPAGATEQFAPTGAVDLRGFTYERVDVAWEELLQRLHPYDRQPYTQLETVLRAAGEDHDADRVYLARRASERKRLWQQWKRRPFDFLPALLDFLNWVIPHYGVRPLRLLVFTILLLAFGVLVFSSPNAVTPRIQTRSVVDTSGPQMVIQRKEEPTTLGNPLESLGVSLNVLLPLELPAGGDWQPSDCYVHIGGAGDCKVPPAIAITYAFYGTLQRLAGWVVVPLGIAALTGLLSRRPPGGPEQHGAGGEG